MRRDTIPFVGLTLATIGGCLGVMWSVATSDKVRSFSAPAFASSYAQAEPSDPGQAGRAWAQFAYGSGLRECPRLTHAYHAACAAEMKVQARLAAEVGQASRRWARENVEYAANDIPEPAYRPEPIEAATTEAQADLWQDAAYREKTPTNYPAEQPVTDETPIVDEGA